MAISKIASKPELCSLSGTRLCLCLGQPRRSLECTSLPRNCHDYPDTAHVLVGLPQQVAQTSSQASPKSPEFSGRPAGISVYQRDSKKSRSIAKAEASISRANSSSIPGLLSSSLKVSASVNASFIIPLHCFVIRATSLSCW